jgi:hypothetical protein
MFCRPLLLPSSMQTILSDQPRRQVALQLLQDKSFFTRLKRVLAAE